MKSIFIFFISFQFAYSQYFSPVHNLSQEKIWLSLLHYNNGVSSIKNKSFFLAKNGMHNPKEEMLKTISAYNSDNYDIICKFPARCFWLATKLNWTDINHKLKYCVDYNKWEPQINVQSISMVFVSGYLGNPASAFGHSFLKINKSNNKNTLSDITVSYGAILPKKYGLLSYTYNGLFGGYQGSYRHKYYYMDDIEYSNKEFREIWEYQLDLTEDSKKLFLMHLWELEKITFDYYFFNRNCGYKISELLEVTSSKNILDRALIWYAPIETFYKLENAINNVKYYPSLQQKVYAHYKGLNLKQKNIINDILLYSQLDSLEDKKIVQISKIKILDFLIEFYTYKLQQIDKQSLEYLTTKKEKSEVLRQRIKLPVLDTARSSPSNKRSIIKDNKPRKITTVIQNKNKEYEVIFGFSPFIVDELGYNLSFGDSFSVLDTDISIGNRIKISKVDLIKIRRLKYEQLPFDISSSLSWKLHLGMQNLEIKDYFVKLGLGYSWNLFNNSILYSMVDFSLHSNNVKYRINPYLGLFIDRDILKFNIEYGSENSIVKTKQNEKFNVRVQYSLTQNNGIFVEFKKEEKINSLTAGIKWYF